MHLSRPGFKSESTDGGGKDIAFCGMLPPPRLFQTVGFNLTCKQHVLNFNADNFWIAQFKSLPYELLSCCCAVQAPILCEMASFVASCCPEGEEVAMGYCEVAEQWATELRHELSRLTQASSSSRTQHSPKQMQLERKELKVKMAMCHYLVVIACGCSAKPGTVTHRDLRALAGKVCKHMLMVRYHLPLRQWFNLTWCRGTCSYLKYLQAAKRTTSVCCNEL
jgi:hypothetical protein